MKELIRQGRRREAARGVFFGESEPAETVLPPPPSCLPEGPENGKEPPPKAPPPLDPDPPEAGAVGLAEDEYLAEVIAVRWVVARYRQGADGRRRKVGAVNFEEVQLFASDREEDTNAFGDQVERLLRQSELQARERVEAAAPGGEN